MHARQLGGGGGHSCKRSRWHCGTSLAALCRCRLHTGFWINGSEMIYLGYLPPEHRHAHTHKHTHTTQASSLPPCCSYGDADAEIHQEGEERNLAEQHPIVSPWVTLSDKCRDLPTQALSLCLDSHLSLIHTHLFSDIMGNMTEVTLRIADFLTSASPATSAALSGEISAATR